MSRVYMGHLAYDIKESDIDHFFRGYGHIKDLTIKNGYGFVVNIRIKYM